MSTPPIKASPTLGTTVIGLLLIMTVGACSSNATSGGEAPTTEAPTSQVDGLPLTTESVAGIWYEDTGSGYWLEPIIARFASDGTFALGGVFDVEAWINGTFALDDQVITFTATGGGCSSRDTFTWDVVIVADGRLEAVHAGSDGEISGLVGDCPFPSGSRTTSRASRRPRPQRRASPPPSTGACAHE